MRSATWFRVVLVVFGLAIAGCGDSTGTGSATDSRRSADSWGQRRSRAFEESKQAPAVRSLLRKADLISAGFKRDVEQLVRESRSLAADDPKRQQIRTRMSKLKADWDAEMMRIKQAMRRANQDFTRDFAFSRDNVIRAGE